MPTASTALHRRCTLQMFFVALLLSLGLITISLDVQLAWKMPPSVRHGLRSISSMVNVATPPENAPTTVSARMMDGATPPEAPPTRVSSENFSELLGEKLRLVQTLHDVAQNTSQSRGIVIPVYEAIIVLAASLVLELRTMGVDAPVEMPPCGDVTVESQELLMRKEALGSIRFYDVCELAAATKVQGNSSKNVFCKDLEACHTKFRSFDIKVIAVVFSKFEEIMMVDADTAFFVNPTVLWGSEKFKKTGTLFMNDRHAHEILFLAERVNGNASYSFLHRYMAKFNPAPFHFLPTLKREKATLPNPAPVELKFEPSDYLLSSHSWNLRTGHQVDSSLMFWNKKLQQRATAILGSFKSLSGVGSPPSYGDKELYFYAAELAESKYAFSDHAVGAVGTDYRDFGEKNSTLCGDMAHVFPIEQASEDDVPLFYLNNDRVLHLKPEVEPVYYMKAQKADVYLGPFGKRRMECPFEMTGARFSPAEARHLTGRQRLYQLVLEWERVTHSSAGDADTRKSLDAAADATVDELMHEMRNDYRQVNTPKI